MGLPMVPGSELPAMADDAIGYGGRALYEWEVERLYGLVSSPKARAYIHALMWTGRICKALRLAEADAKMPTYWRKAHPGFREFEDELREEIRLRALDFAMDRVETGFEEQIYTHDGEGNRVLKSTRVRRDPGFTKAWLASIDESWRPSQEGTTNIIVNVVQVDE